MCYLHQLSDADKLVLQNQLLAFASAIGGKNSLLKLLETIKNTSPHPLISKTTFLRFPKGIIKWNKNIHRDNLALLSKRMNERIDENQNLMVSAEDKSYKSVVNMLRSLGPLNFSVSMNNEADGTGFSFHAFEIKDETTTILNPIFELFFFCSLSVTKKLLNFVLKTDTTSE